MYSSHSLQLKDSIATRLLKVVFSFYLLVALTITLIHMVAEFYNTRNSIRDELHMVKITIGPGIANSMWDEYWEQVQSILVGTVQLPVVVGVRITNEHGEEVGRMGTMVDDGGQTILVDAEGNQVPTSDDGGLSGLFWQTEPILYNDDGNQVMVGQITLYSSLNVVFERVQLGFFLILVNSVIKTLALWAIFLWVFHYLLHRPLAALTTATEELNLDNLQLTQITVETKGRNELKILEEAFNAMIQKLSHDMNRIISLTHTFEKFVPKQFLEKVATDGVESIRLGNVSSAHVTILFNDIRSFTTLAEQMPPQNVFNFLNSYLARMNPLIEKNHGYVDKFIGDAIMALFDQRAGTEHQAAQNAVHAAIEMQQELSLYNRHRQKSGYPRVAAGTGIHSGHVIIGTLGSENRMDTTAIGDAVNLASRLEDLTKYYRTPIIVSSATLDMLQDDSTIFSRELDYVAVKGKTQLVSIYEIFNPDEDRVISLKHQILPKYHEGILQFRSRHWQDAIQLFQECLKLYPNDILSRMYLERSLQFQELPPVSDWQGSLKESTPLPLDSNPFGHSI